MGGEPKSEQNHGTHAIQGQWKARKEWKKERERDGKCLINPNYRMVVPNVVLIEMSGTFFWNRCGFLQLQAEEKMNAFICMYDTVSKNEHL